jgi:hypothetical protein
MRFQQIAPEVVADLEAKKRALEVKLITLQSEVQFLEREHARVMTEIRFYITFVIHCSVCRIGESQN